MLIMILRFDATGFIRAQTSSVILLMEKVSGSNSIFPASIFARSSTSLISCSKCWPLVKISLRNSFWFGFSGPTLPSTRISAKPITALSGVRSSCDILARNSLFKRLAS